MSTRLYVTPAAAAKAAARRLGCERPTFARHLGVAPNSGTHAPSWPRLAMRMIERGLIAYAPNEADPSGPVWYIGPTGERWLMDCYVGAPSPERS